MCVGVCLAQSDALTLSVVLLLQDLLVQAGRSAERPVHLVAMIERKETVDVINFLLVCSPPLAAALTQAIMSCQRSLCLCKRSCIKFSVRVKLPPKTQLTQCQWHYHRAVTS